MLRVFVLPSLTLDTIVIAANISTDPFWEKPSPSHSPGEPTVVEVVGGDPPALPL